MDNTKKGHLLAKKRNYNKPPGHMTVKSDVNKQGELPN